MQDMASNKLEQGGMRLSQLLLQRGVIVVRETSHVGSQVGERGDILLADAVTHTIVGESKETCHGIHLEHRDVDGDADFVVLIDHDELEGFLAAIDFILFAAGRSQVQAGVRTDIGFTTRDGGRLGFHQGEDGQRVWLSSCDPGETVYLPANELGNQRKLVQDARTHLAGLMRSTIG